MRIGLIAPPWVPVPPPAYGGIEAAIDNLARGLRDRGHDVELFTVRGSTCPVTVSHIYDTPPRPIGVGEYEMVQAAAGYEQLTGVDVIHDHTAYGPSCGPLPDSPPVVATCHGPATPGRRLLYGRFASRVPIIAISHAQKRLLAPVPMGPVIHHGIDLKQYRPGPGDGGYLLFVGRMSPEKGVHHAVRIAKAAGRQLIIVAKMREDEEFEYYEQQVRPLLSADDPPPVEEPLHRRIELMQHAEALLNPICWDEPFGLVMGEALACGTPVLAYPNGAAPEIVEHGKTGFVCADADEMTIAIGKLSGISRRACREAAEQRFSLERMVADHERLYLRVAASQPRHAPLLPLGV